MPRVRVLFFAASREAAGRAAEEVELEPGATTQSLLARLLADHPRLEGVMRSCVFAVNQEYVQPSQGLELAEGDEVAIIPPLSGG